MAERSRRRTGRGGGRPIAVDFFCGAGGMSLGFEQAGFDVVWASDVDPHHVATHARNFPYGKVVCEPIEAFSLQRLHEALGGPVEVDLVFGGPPCQGFSNMGLRDSKDPRNALVDQFASAIEQIRPKAFVMENVPGMLAGETRRVLDGFIERMEAADYEIARPVRVLNAADFGVPQKRLRLFVVGVRRGVGDPAEYPTAACTGQPERPTVLQAICDLPQAAAPPELFGGSDVPYDRQPSSPYACVARGKTKDPSDFSRPRLWNPSVCTGCTLVAHSDKAIRLYAATRPGTMVPGHKLPRLDPDGIAPTLRAGSDSSHGSYTAPRPIHPLEPRCITVREAARLHGYPDWFAFYPSKWHAYRQVGNSVCPPVARAIGRQVMAAIGAVPAKPLDAPLPLGGFQLARTGAIGQRRIPHIQQYPPVIASLFAQGYDPKAGRLWRSRFTFDDVRRAIVVTGANLPWVRRDNFLQDIARSRNAAAILAPCLDRGFSIRPLHDGAFLGEFVPSSEADTIEKRDVLSIRTSDIANAHPVTVTGRIDARRPETLTALLSVPELSAELWGNRQRLLLDGSNGMRRNGSGILRAYTRKGVGTSVAGLAWMARLGAPPTEAKLWQAMREAGANEAVVLVPVTDEHIHASAIEGTPNGLARVKSRVFSIRHKKGRTG